MAFPTAVNDQITDSVTESNVQVLGSAPSQAMGALMQGISQALSIAAENATMQQQNGVIMAQAATTLAVSTLLNPRGTGKT